jgi:hypothetical protein
MRPLVHHADSGRKAWVRATVVLVTDANLVIELRHVVTPLTLWPTTLTPNPSQIMQIARITCIIDFDHYSGQLILCDIDCRFQGWIYSFTDFGEKS